MNMEFEKKVSPSVIDQTLFSEKETSISVKPELEVSSVLNYFEERRDPDGKFKKKSRENYKYLIKIYWPYYLIPLGEAETAIGIDGMALDPHEIYSDLTITREQVERELTNLDDDAILNSLVSLQGNYQNLGETISVAGILKAEFTKSLISLANYGENEGFLGIPISQKIGNVRAEEIFNKVDNYSNRIDELKKSIDNKNNIIDLTIKKKHDTVSSEIKNLNDEYDLKLDDLKPIIEDNKNKINDNRATEIKHLQEERQTEVAQTMNLIKESFKPIENKVKLINDLWEKDKNNVLGIVDADTLVSEVHSSIEMFKARNSEFEKELTNIDQEIRTIAGRFLQINQKFDNEESIVNEKFDKQIQEEDDKITALENERKDKIQAREDIQDKLKR